MFVLVVILVVFKNTLWLAISVQDVVSLWVGADEGSVPNSIGEKTERERGVKDAKYWDYEEIDNILFCEDARDNVASHKKGIIHKCKIVGESDERLC